MIQGESSIVGGEEEEEGEEGVFIVVVVVEVEDEDEDEDEDVSSTINFKEREKLEGKIVFPCMKFLMRAT